MLDEWEKKTLLKKPAVEGVISAGQANLEFGTRENNAANEA